MPAAGSSSARGYDGRHRRLRLVVFERDGWVCRWCGGTVTPETADLDHVVALALGGPGHDLENLVTACRTCNRRRGGQLGARRRHRATRFNPSRRWL